LGIFYCYMYNCTDASAFVLCRLHHDGRIDALNTTDAELGFVYSGREARALTKQSVKSDAPDPLNVTLRSSTYFTNLLRTCYRYRRFTSYPRRRCSKESNRSRINLPYSSRFAGAFDVQSPERSSKTRRRRQGGDGR